MASQERIQEICNLVDDDETLKSWIKRAKEGWITGYECLALIHHSVCDPDNRDQNSGIIIDHWMQAINSGLENGILVPFSKHSYRRLALKDIKDSNNEWFIGVSDADTLLQKYNLSPFCADTINFLFEEVFPKEPKKQTSAKESPRKIENLCRAIACLAIDAYGYKPEDSKSPVPKQLSEIMLKDFNVNISDRTIRNWIKEGLEKIEISQHKI